MTPADGGAAFPAGNEANVNGTMGMSLRDWFAGQAFSSFVAATISAGIPLVSDRIAACCYELADAMLAERTK